MNVGYVDMSLRLRFQRLYSVWRWGVVCHKGKDSRGHDNSSFQKEMDKDSMISQARRL